MSADTIDLYGPWLRDLNQQDLPSALCAAGVAAALAPELLVEPHAEEEVADRLRAVLGQQPPGTPVRWKDPLLVESWDPAVAPSAGVLAKAWRGGPVVQVNLLRGLVVETGPGGPEPTWLSEQLCWGNAGAFLPLSGRGVPPVWRFPLRIGFLDGAPSRQLRTELEVARAAGTTEWRRTLLEPIALGRERVTCDILVLPEAAAGLDALHRAREVRTGIVFVLSDADSGPGTDSGTAPRILTEMATHTGAWAAGFRDGPDPAAWLIKLCRELTHNMSLDIAFMIARRVYTSGLVNRVDRGLLMARPEIVGQQRLARRAESVAAQLWAEVDPASAPNERRRVIARDLDEIAAHGAFLRESDEASDVVEMERRAAPLTGQSAAARFLQADIAAAAEPAVNLPRFRPGTEHIVRVRVAPFSARSLTAAVSFPDLTTPQRLKVVLIEPDLLDRPLEAAIDLPITGPSTTATFTLTTRPDTIAADARIVVLSGNRVLQTARLPRAVGSVDGSPETAVAEPETMVASTTESLGDRRTFDAAFVVDAAIGEDGAAGGVATVAGTVTSWVRIDGVNEALAQITKRVREIVEQPADFGALDATGTVELLNFLAYHGSLMRSALVDNDGMAEALANSHYLQVVSARAEAFFPIELAYDFPAPDRDATLCPDAAAALSSTELGATTCPGAHTRATVCPFGFWGVNRVIERQAYQKGQHDLATADFLVRSGPTRDCGTIQLGTAVFAASNKVDTVEPGSIARVLSSLTSAAGPPRHVLTWDDWPIALLADPGLLMLLPHTVFDDREAVGLEIGADARLWSANIEKEYVPATRPVIVTLLGCDTALAGQVGYERFPTCWRRAGAKIIVATLTEILGRHAAPIAEAFVTELYTFCATEPHGVGEVMVRLRRRMLARGLPAVLALAVFGDADWLVAAGAP